MTETPKPTNARALHALLACVDGSIYADSVLAHAAWAAQRLQAGVRVLHVQEPHPNQDVPAERSGNLVLGQRTKLLEQLAQVDEARAKLDMQKGRLILTHAREELARMDITDVETLHRRGGLVETLAELEKEASLVLIGKRGEQANLADQHLGSNLERVVRAAQRPVLVCNRAFQPIARIALAYDGGPSTRRALEALCDSPLVEGATIHVLHVGRDEANSRTVAAEAAQRLESAGRTVEVGIYTGNPDKVIPEVVAEQKIGMLVMGAYGHSRLRTLIIGSTTSAMLRTCRIPLLLFR